MKYDLVTVLMGIILVLLVYIAYELARKLLGGSLGFEELVIALLVTNVGYSFHLKDSINKIDAKLSGHLGWHNGQEEV